MLSLNPKDTTGWHTFTMKKYRRIKKVFYTKATKSMLLSEFRSLVNPSSGSAKPTAWAEVFKAMGINPSITNQVLYFGRQVCVPYMPPGEDKTQCFLYDLRFELNIDIHCTLSGKRNGYY